MPSPRAITKSSWRAVLEPHRAADQVLDHGLALVGDPQADRRARLVGAARRGSRRRRGLLPGADVVGGRRVGVGVAGLEQLVERSPRGARGARTGSPGPRPSRAPASAARRGSARRSPASSARGPCPRSAAPAPARAARQQPVVECRPGAADVQRAGRRRCEAKARGRVIDADRRACFHGKRNDAHNRAGLCGYHSRYFSSPVGMLVCEQPETDGGGVKRWRRHHRWHGADQSGSDADQTAADADQTARTPTRAPPIAIRRKRTRTSAHQTETRQLQTTSSALTGRRRAGTAGLRDV